ncbi:MAG: hypothetical protein WBY44_11410 [Bryobacteraceae bacterium]
MADRHRIERKKNSPEFERSGDQSAMTVKLRRKNPRYRDLTLGVPYVVIGIEANDYRILNDAGRPYSYPARLFEIADSREPKDWISGYGDDGERYAYPPPLNEPGFFEDFFENRAKTVKTFWNVVNERLATVGRVA